jgi:thermostable 8-oxoguanine DNA glycosylase
MQNVRILVDDEVRVLELPAPAEEVLPHVPWGEYDVLFTPAFWAARVWLLREEQRFSSFRFGDSLREEAAACVLGGHGIPAEVGLAAFARLRERGLLVSGVMEAEIQEALLEPLCLGDRLVRYRFARQRSERLAAILTDIDGIAFDSDRALRAALLHFPGVGPKTASWIVRNHLGSDEVAILDIHVVRACIAAKVFPRDVNLGRDYFDLEDRFLMFADALNARPSILDSVMWHHMRQIGHPDSFSH